MLHERQNQPPKRAASPVNGFRSQLSYLYRHNLTHQVGEYRILQDAGPVGDSCSRIYTDSRTA